MSQRPSPIGYWQMGVSSHTELDARAICATTAIQVLTWPPDRSTSLLQQPLLRDSSLTVSNDPLPSVHTTLLLKGSLLHGQQ